MDVKFFNFTSNAKYRGKERIFVSKNMEVAMLFDFYGDMLTEKQRDMIELYYNDDLSLSEIAENEGITRQGVRDSIKRAENQLLEMEEKLGLVRRFRDIRAGMESIARQAAEIADYNRFGAASREIDERARAIQETAERLAQDEV